MGRPSAIKPAILYILNRSDIPLRFNDLQSLVQTELNRKKLDDKQFNVNLQSLVNAGSVEVVLFNQKKAYILASSHYEQKLKLDLIKLIRNRKSTQLYDRIDGDETPPLTAFVDPPAFDYQTKKPLETTDYNSYGGGPTTKIGDVRRIIEWTNPSKAISSIMENDFLGFLSKAEQYYFITFCRWAYWAGVKSYIEDNSFRPIEKTIENNKIFAQNCIKKFSSDDQRVKMEKMLIRILDITYELVQKQNLEEFFKFLINHRDEHSKLLSTILCFEGPMGSGERIFNNFFDFHSHIISGMSQAGLLHDEVQLNQRPISERFLLTNSEVWNEFFGNILFDHNYNYSDPEIVSDLQKIGGSLKEAITKVKGLKQNVSFLLELPLKRKIAIIYLWGFPETAILSDRSSIRDFDSWLITLKKGDLDHRIWLFSEKTLNRLYIAYRAVKQHKSPPNFRIDKVLWSLEDLYDFHPLGRELTFWENIIDIIKSRLNNQRRIYRGGPVPEEVYKKFVKKESAVIEQMLDDEEKNQKKHSRNRR